MLATFLGRWGGGLSHRSPTSSQKTPLELLTLIKVSGFRLTFDLSRPEMSRLVLAEVTCPDCPMQWSPLKVIAA